MPQKTITVEHPEAHQASQADFEAAVAAAEVPEDYTIAHAVNESGVSTKWVLKWGEDAPETEADAEPAPAEPRSRRKSG